MLRSLFKMSVGGLALVSAIAETRFEFLEPTPHAAFLEGVEVPLVLVAQVPKETVTSAEVFVDGALVGTAVFCCPVCRCLPPVEGMPLELRLPGISGPSFWQGLTNLSRGFHQITATATGSGGTALTAVAVQIVILSVEDLTLRVSLTPEHQLQFVLPGGSLVFGGFDMWMSHDLEAWTRLGPFEPGAVAAFFRDQPDLADPRPRYYRAWPADTAGQSR